MTTSSNSVGLHAQLRLATTACHHVLESHPLLSCLLGNQPSRRQYGNTLAALHGIYAQAEAVVLQYLQNNPHLFDYASHRKLWALEADLAALGRLPVPMNMNFPTLETSGALFGTLYVLEGSTLGGQFIARKLLQHVSPAFPLQFYTLYGDKTQQRWREFLQCANERCPVKEYDAAAAAAVELFMAFKTHLDDSQRYFLD